MKNVVLEKDYVLGIEIDRDVPTIVWELCDIFANDVEFMRMLPDSRFKEVLEKLFSLGSSGKLGLDPVDVATARVLVARLQNLFAKNAEGICLAEELNSTSYSIDRVLEVFKSQLDMLIDCYSKRGYYFSLSEINIGAFVHFYKGGLDKAMTVYIIEK